MRARRTLEGINAVREHSGCKTPFVSLSGGYCRYLQVKHEVEAAEHYMPRHVAVHSAESVEMAAMLTKSRPHFRGLGSSVEILECVPMRGM